MMYPPSQQEQEAACPDVEAMDAAAAETLGLMIKDIEWKIECVPKRHGLSRTNREGLIAAYKEDIAALRLAIDALTNR